MTNNKQSTYNDEEINLSGIIRRISEAVVYPFKLFISNIVISLLFAGASVLTCFTLKYTVPKIYKVNFVIKPGDRFDKVHIMILEDLARMIDLEDYEGLAKELKLKVETASMVKDLEAVNYMTFKAKEDSLSVTEVVLKLKDYTVADTFQSAICNYLESNPAYTKSKKIEKANIELRYAMLEKDIVMLDSLKELQIAAYNRVKTSDQNALLIKDFINPRAFYDLAQDRLYQKTTLNAQLEYLDNFQVSKNVIKIAKPFWPPRILYMLLVFGPLFMLACFIYLHYRAKKKLQA